MRCRKPVDALLALRIIYTWVEDSVLNCWDVVGRRRRGGLEFRDWDFHIDCADFIRSCVWREAWYWAEAREVGGHHGDVQS